MTESDARTPIPVLLVGDGAPRIESSLTAGLAAAGMSGRFSCAAFASVDAAANASAGATKLILIALGPAAERILSSPVWAPWEAPGSAMARIAMSDALPAIESGAEL
ncbi:hypothetical protein K2X89_17185, partial [Myxococcota bacterium]|nr:hypothetical protein [Myxococcota bacterium]